MPIINAPPTQGLMLYYSFDEGVGGVVHDLSGNKNHGSILDGNNLNWVDGILGKALNIRSFSGVSTKITFGPIPVSNIGHTVSMWVYAVPGSSNYGTLFSQNNNAGIWFYQNKINYFYSVDHLNNTALAFNTWYHVLITCNDSAIVTFYLNGKVDGTASGAASYNANYIGNDNGNEAFRGYIDELRVYNRVLSSTEIQTLYSAGSTKLLAANNSGLVGFWPLSEGSAGTAHDFSGNNNHGQLVNNPTWVNGKLGKALSFNGSNQYVMIAKDPLSSVNAISFTIAFWAKPISITANTYTYVAGNTDNILNKGFQIGLEDRGSVNGFTALSKALTVYVGTVSGNNFGFALNNAFDVFSDWHFWVITYTATVGTIYKDGTIQTTSNSTVHNGSGNLVPRNISMAIAVVADTVGDTHKFNAFIDEVRIYNKALSVGDVWNLYQATS